jgi:hypothetical protein
LSQLTYVALYFVKKALKIYSLSSFEDHNILTHIYKCKKYLLKPFQEWGRGIKDIGGRGEFKYDLFDTL